MARIIKDSEYKCSLSEETLKKAKEELGEDQNSRLVLVKELRKRVEKIPVLQARTDFCFLLAFLRARKFEQERAYQLIKHYYEVKKDGDFFDDLKPSRVKHVIDAGVLEVLKERDHNGCRVVIIRPGRWDPDCYPMFDIPKTMFLILSKLVEEEETQVHGVHVINNLAEITWKQGKHMSPAIAKRILSVLQDMLPLRLKRLDYVHEPKFFDALFTIVKQFMSDKLVSRIHMNGSSYEELHTTINPDFLPTDLGGKAELFSNKEFIEGFLRSDAMFEENNKFGYVSDTKKKKGKEPEDAGLQGLGGTFKKLDV